MQRSGVTDLEMKTIQRTTKVPQKINEGSQIGVDITSTELARRQKIPMIGDHEGWEDRSKVTLTVSLVQENREDKTSRMAIRTAEGGELHAIHYR